MNRPIKFRAWDKKNKKWLDSTDFLITADGLVLLYDKECGREVEGLTGAWREDEEEDIEIVRFTGLTDKNGKEIYEGDILEDRGDPQLITRSVVEFIDGSFWSKGWGRLGNHNEDSEVIGNIYENPELL